MIKEPSLESFVRERAVRLGLVVGLLLAAGACSQRDLGEQSPDPDDTAQLTLALVSAPAEVACVVIHLASDMVIDRLVNLSGGVSSFTLSRLPVGVTVITVDAFADCAALAPGSAPTWIGGPVTITLHPGHNSAPPIPMRRAGRLSVELDFSGSPGTAPICAADQAACTNDTHCCSQRCVIPSSSESRIGTCQAPLAEPLPAVQIRLVGEKQYLFFPVDGLTSCPRTTGELHTVTLQPGQKVCLESPAFDGATAVLLDELLLCEAGQPCAECQSDSCRPAGCFPSLAPTPSSTVCPGLQLNGLVANTRYLIARSALPASPQETLPQFFQTDATDDLTIGLPPGRTSFAVARVGTRFVPPPGGGGGICGSTSLCGVLDFRAFSALPGWQFQFLPGNLNIAPVF